MGFLSSLTGGGVLDAVGGFMGARAQKKQTKNIIRDYNSAQQGATEAYAPFLSGGTNAFNSALAMQQPGYDYTSNDPGYNYIQDQSLNAVQRSAAASGALHSGGTIKDILRNSSGIAAQDFNNSFSRNAALARFGLEGAGGTSNALFAGAQGRASAYKDRGKAISDQWGAGVDFTKSVAGMFGGF